MAEREAAGGNEMARGPIRLDAALIAKPWGGRTLARFGFQLPPDELIGEAHLTGAEARVLDGPLAPLMTSAKRPRSTSPERACVERFHWSIPSSTARGW